MTPRALFRLAGLALVAAGLAACVDFDKMDHDAYVAGCAKLGIDQSSPDFNQCMMQQQRLQAESDQDFLDRQALAGN